MSYPLAGMAVLVTRPAAQAEPLCRRLQALGAEVYRLPTLAVEPLPVDAALRDALHWAAAADWLVFVSRNAVEIGLDALDRLGLPPGPGSRYAAIGPATAQALESRGLGVHVQPKDGFNSEALLAEPGWDLHGRRVAILRGVGGRELLRDAMIARGAQVRYIEVYRRVVPQIDAEAVLVSWMRGTIPVAVVTSQDGLINLMRLTPPRYHAALSRAMLVCASDRVAAKAAELGLRGRRRVAPMPGDEGIVQALLPAARNNDNRKPHDGING